MKAIERRHDTIIKRKKMDLQSLALRLSMRSNSFRNSDPPTMPPIDTPDYDPDMNMPLMNANAKATAPNNTKEPPAE